MTNSGRKLLYNFPLQKNFWVLLIWKVKMKPYILHTMQMLVRWSQAETQTGWRYVFADVWRSIVFCFVLQGTCSRNVLCASSHYSMVWQFSSSLENLKRHSWGDKWSLWYRQESTTFDIQHRFPVRREKASPHFVKISFIFKIFSMSCWVLHLKDFKFSVFMR